MEGRWRPCGRTARRRPRSPSVVRKSAEPWNRSPQIADSTLGWRFVNPEMPKPWTISLGETAEVVASRHAISREDQDRFAAESQERAARAVAEGAFDDEVVPGLVRGPGGRGGG